MAENTQLYKYTLRNRSLEGCFQIQVFFRFYIFPPGRKYSPSAPSVFLLSSFIRLGGQMVQWWLFTSSVQIQKFSFDKGIQIWLLLLWLSFYNQIMLNCLCLHVLSFQKLNLWPWLALNNLYANTLEPMVENFECVAPVKRPPSCDHEVCHGEVHQVEVDCCPHRLVEDHLVHKFLRRGESFSVKRDWLFIDESFRSSTLIT